MSTATLSNPGTLIHARGREWVVLPESTDDVLMARPVGGLDEEITGIMPAVEQVASAVFPLPTRGTLVTSRQASFCAKRPACPRAPPPAPSAALAASQWNHDPTSSCP